MKVLTLVDAPDIGSPLLIDNINLSYSSPPNPLINMGDPFEKNTRPNVRAPDSSNFISPLQSRVTNENRGPRVTNTLDPFDDIEPNTRSDTTTQPAGLLPTT